MTGPVHFIDGARAKSAGHDRGKECLALYGFGARRTMTIGRGA